MATQNRKPSGKARPLAETMLAKRSETEIAELQRGVFRVTDAYRSGD